MVTLWKFIGRTLRARAYDTRLHDDVVHVLARLWNCPAPPADDAAAAGTVYAGAGTVGPFCV
jgi:hypothetical protein